MSSEKIVDFLYIRKIEKVIQRRLTQEELDEIYIYGECELEVAGKNFIAQIPNYSVYDLIAIDKLEYMYALPYRDIKKYKAQKYLNDSFSYVDIMEIRETRPTDNQFKPGEHFIEFLHVLEQTLNPPVLTAC